LNETARNTTDTALFSASSVEAAIALGLEEMGIPKQDAEITIVDRGSRGFLGFRARDARVRVAPRDHLSPVVQDLAEKMLSLMGFEAEVITRQTGSAVTVEFRAGEGDALLIGRRGETLEALQHVLLRMAGKKLGSRLESVTLDISGYRARREEKLVQLARTLAERVERTGRRAMTEPLTAGERRIVHNALEGRKGVTTQVGGRGGNQRILITPRRRSRSGRSR
jgi:spoIIIJ-associated protein